MSSIEEEVYNGLRFYGSPILDLFLYEKLEKTYNLKFMINVEDHTNIIKRVLVWNYSTDTRSIVNQSLLLAELISFHNLYSYLVVMISINDSHRNILILNNRDKIIYYFEPNDASIEYYDETVYHKFQDKQDITRNTIISIIKSLSLYREYEIFMRIRDVATTYYGLTEVYNNDITKSLILSKSCTEMCYYYLYKIINDELDLSTWNITNMLKILLKLSLQIVNDHRDELEGNYATFDQINRFVESHRL